MANFTLRYQIPLGNGDFFAFPYRVYRMRFKTTF
jgi:hypothetical protein